MRFWILAEPIYNSRNWRPTGGNSKKAVYKADNVSCVLFIWKLPFRLDLFCDA